jgi:coenzyme PQQ synthesis protein D (PqqD)
MSAGDNFAKSVYCLSERTSLQGLGEDEGGVLLKLESGEIYTVNDTAYAFLANLDGRSSVRDCIGAIVVDFDVDEPTLLSDLEELMVELEAESLVTRSE